MNSETTSSHLLSPVITVEDAARLSSLPIGTIRHWISRGKLPSIRPGKRRLIRRADLAETLGIPLSDLQPAAKAS